MFQAEYGVTNGEVMFRSAASDGKTVRFTEEGQFVYWIFKTPPRTCGFDILNVIYSNDGPSDNITVWLDEEYVDGFETFNHRKEGAFWNYMRESGLLGTAMALTEGNHTLNVSVSSVDVHGVEIDEVIVGVLCDDIKECSESLLIYNQPKNVVPVDPNETSRLPTGDIIAIVSVIVAAVIGLPGAIVAIYKCRSARFKCRSPKYDTFKDNGTLNSVGFNSKQTNQG